MRLRDLFIVPDDILMGFSALDHKWVTDQYAVWRVNQLPSSPSIPQSAWDEASELGAALALRIEPVEVEFLGDDDEELAPVGLSLRGFGQWPPEHVATILQTPGKPIEPTAWALHQSPRVDAMCAWVADDWTSWVNAPLTAALMTWRRGLTYEQAEPLAGIRALGGDEVVGAVMPLRPAEIPPLPNLQAVSS